VGRAASSRLGEQQNAIDVPLCTKLGQTLSLLLGWADLPGDGTPFKLFWQQTFASALTAYQTHFRERALFSATA
jgi:hypothetical protein